MSGYPAVRSGSPDEDARIVKLTVALAPGDIFCAHLVSIGGFWSLRDGPWPPLAGHWKNGRVLILVDDAALWGADMSREQAIEKATEVLLSSPNESPKPCCKPGYAGPYCPHGHHWLVESHTCRQCDAESAMKDSGLTGG